ncbi:tyrosine-type recombinase/integrase [Bradyrhizobium japonicum]|uniref:tyrosine-type recombinase/integrase n=1 Tax=Bradyrhizobium japonicum TaxID=375 RepID=UPI00209F61ED|nr:site-specific integrase [Bradyrhizobium japonicum]MCP1774747.1 site-specific recombinase XerD [Bradyrhizobium japonicum]MCP1962253.1 site-specific recombinase XerD [Bradyrhizobium japonicum]
MDGARYLEDGRLTIFRRAGIYYARLRLSPGKYVTRSLKTTVEETAVQLGRRLLFQLEHRAEQGLPPKSKLFSSVIDDYISYRERDHAHGKTSAGMLRQIRRVSKFWRDCAGHLAVEDIDDKVMRDFIPWRRDYYASFDKLPKNAKRHPTDKTLQWDMMLGKAIVKWAAEQGWRGDKPSITVTFTPKKKRVRPAFEQWEYRLLWRTLCKRVGTARDVRTRKSRELLRSYVLVLANSGIRTGEADNLRVRDVHPFTDDKGRKNFRFVVRGKTGERDAILRSVAAKRLDKYLTKRREEDPSGLLFVMPDGSKIITLIDQLNAALREAQILKSSFGEKYSVYSLRHFYAVNALRNGVGVFEVARNMGTSVEIIQEYYGKQATASVFATRLGD